MKLDTLEAVFSALNDAGVRYLVAGGVAVNAHGYARLTQDLDLVVALDRPNLESGLGALRRLGYHPSLPVDAGDFADPEIRRRWVEARNMEVFSLVSEAHPGTPVDLFAREPFDFDTEHAAAFVAELAPGTPVRFVRLSTLIEMKESLGRDRDRDDVKHLRWILEEEGDGG